MTVLSNKYSQEEQNDMSEVISIAGKAYQETEIMAFN